MLKYSQLVSLLLTDASLKFQLVCAARPPGSKFFAVEACTIAFLLQIGINCAGYYAACRHIKYFNLIMLSESLAPNYNHLPRAPDHN